MKLKIETPMARAPMVAAGFSLSQCPAMAVPAMPMSGTVMFETMFGRAIRNISRFMFMELLVFSGCKDRVVARNMQSACEEFDKKILRRGFSGELEPPLCANPEKKDYLCRIFQPACRSGMAGISKI